jgi:hypothetical protein
MVLRFEPVERGKKHRLMTNILFLAGYRDTCSRSTTSKQARPASDSPCTVVSQQPHHRCGQKAGTSVTSSTCRRQQPSPGTSLLGACGRGTQSRVLIGSIRGEASNQVVGTCVYDTQQVRGCAHVCRHATRPKSCETADQPQCGNFKYPEVCRYQALQYQNHVFDFISTIKERWQHARKVRLFQMFACALLNQCILSRFTPRCTSAFKLTHANVCAISVQVGKSLLATSAVWLRTSLQRCAGRSICTDGLFHQRAAGHHPGERGEGVCRQGRNRPFQQPLATHIFAIFGTQATIGLRECLFFVWSRACTVSCICMHRRSWVCVGWLYVCACV